MLEKAYVGASGDISVLWPMTFLWGSEVLNSLESPHDHSARKPLALPAEKQSRVVNQSRSTLQLREDLHWRDDQEAWDKDEGTLRGLLERNAGEVSRGRTCPKTLPPKELQLKEALHIQTAAEELLNWDIDLEVPGCWLTTLEKSAAENVLP